MQRILNKRVWRELKDNFFRYLALFLMIVLGMYLVVAIVGAAETIIRNMERGQLENRVEDGQFSVFVPLNEDEVAQIETAGVTLEKAFFMDYHVEDATLRIYENREEINLFSLAKGEFLSEEGEILLEQHFAKAHDIGVGDTVLVGSREFIVVGLGSTPDYDAVYEKMSDSSVDSDQFGTGFVLKADYEKLRAEGESFKTEEYCYSYRLDGGITNDELKELIQSFELDRSKVTDTYFLEMVEEAEETKNDITEGIEELLDGSEELSDGLFEIAENNEDVKEAVDSLFEEMLKQTNKGFEEAGISVVLKEESFEEQLNAMLANPNAYSEDTKNNLRDTKETLQDLQDFKEGVEEYTDGVHDASKGSGDLCGGLTEIVENSEALNAGAGQLFDTMLMQVNGQLAEAGVPIVLTADRYGAQLDELIAMYGAYDAQLLASLEAAKEQLNALAGFRDGVKAYTDGVEAASLGSQELTHGMSVLYTANDDLKDGADSIFSAMIDMVNEQLEESDITATITEDNFEAELDKLTAANSQVDSKLKESMTDTKEMLLDLQDFKEGIEEYTDGVDEAADGSLELVDGVKELKEEADEMLEEYFTFDIDNLTSFVPGEDNPRIGASGNDVIINKEVGIIAGVIVMGLFTYVISVFVVHSIEQESSVIGALYALGVKRRQLLGHYLMLPVIVTFLGGAAGCMLGFSPIGINSQTGNTIAYFSMPTLQAEYPIYLLVYSLVMPPLAAIVVNYLVINKKLKRTALSLMRKEENARNIKEMSLGRMGFVSRFQIRQLLRESRSAAAIVGGMFICLLVMMIGVNCYVLCSNFQKASVQETRYEYLYSYKYPTEEVPKGGTEGYMESLKKEAMGYNLEVSILGLTQDNPYFDAPVSDKQNEIVISSAVASKFSVKKGEKLVLSDEVNDKDYAFTIVDVVPYNSALYAFMDIEAMRELFGREEDYYNIIFSNEALDIESGRLYATTSKAGVEEAAKIFVEMMWPMIIVLSLASMIIFMVVMYLMMKVMIDRSAFSISLMKIFGYRKREIKKLYLDGNLLVVAVSALVCVPLAKKTMDALYPYFIANVAIGLDITFSWQLYAGIYAGVMLCYLVINALLVGRLNKVTPAEVLKNRE